MTRAIPFATALLMLVAAAGAQGQTPPAAGASPAADTEGPAQVRGSSMGQQEQLVPGMFEYTTEVLYSDHVWTRPNLSPRDRSLVTLAALAAMGDDDQLDFYLRRAVDSGLSSDQIAEAFTQVAFYAGWPKAMKAQAAAARVLGPASP